AVAGGGGRAGVALVATASLVQAAAALFDVQFVSAFAFVAVVAGIVLAVGGAQAFRAARAALLLLLFMVPLPMQLVASANLQLKLAASAAAVWSAQQVGVIVVQDGAVMVLPGGDALVVGTICSGLRFLVSLAALGAFVALVSGLSTPRKLALF